MQERAVNPGRWSVLLRCWSEDMSEEGFVLMME